MICEIEALKKENQRILQIQLRREAEIRLEISQQMAGKIKELSDQVQELKGQLFKQGRAMEEVTSSNMKKKIKRRVKRQHLYEARNDLSLDLRDSEEQLEYYKTQVNHLTARTKQLEELLCLNGNIINTTNATNNSNEDANGSTSSTDYIQPPKELELDQEKERERSSSMDKENAVYNNISICNGSADE
jgi:hypothetical protein